MQFKFLEYIGMFAKPGARLGFVGIVAGLILLAIAQTIAPIALVLPLEEYRNPAPRPRVFQTILHGDGRLASQINAWFDDRVGFRSILTRLANQIDYSAFNFSKKMLIGKDGWLYDRSYFVEAISFSRWKDGIAPEKEKFGAFVQFLKRRNIRLIVVSTPTKATIYPEFLPSGVPGGPVVTPYMKFREYLKAGNGRGWAYIDGQDLIMKAKNDGPDLFFHTDLHTTTYSNNIIAKTVVNRIAELEGVDLKWNQQLDLSPGDRSNGSDARFLSVFTYRSEKTLEPRKWYDTDNPPPGEVFEASPPPPYEVIFHNKSGRLPRIVLFGNSFVDQYLTLGAYSFFKDVYRVRGWGLTLGDTLRALPPETRYFVYQFWEPHLSGLRAAQIPPD